MILVDTHVVVWLAFDEDRLSKKAQAAMMRAGMEMALPFATSRSWSWPRGSNNLVSSYSTVTDFARFLG